MISSPVRGPWLVGHLFLLIICNILTGHSLPILPNSVRVDTEVLFLKTDESSLHFVEESIDRDGFNIHLKVSNMNRYGDGNDLISYYRIKEDDDSDAMRDKRSIVAFSHKELRCTMSSLNKWHLTDATKLLDRLLQTKELNVTEISKDPLAIGPTALLKIVLSNADRFVLELKAFDDTLLGDMYYFRKSLSLDGGQKMLVVAQVSMFKVKNRELIKYGKTLLSEAEIDSQPSMISVILESGGYFIDGPNKLNSKLLIDSESKDLVKLMVFYSLVEERAADRHMGSNLAQTNEDSPFSLPAGLGCGMVSSHNLFYVGATQFSGFYEALDSTTSEMYIAFDEQSGHLRIDSLGRYKMIHNLKDKRVTYVRESTSDTSQNTFVGNSSSLENWSLCASEIVTDKDDILFSGRRMKEILGLNDETGLMYLGWQRLEDGTPCFVFEREIDIYEIPFICDLHMRLKAFASQRIILTYYFVDEMTAGGPHPLDKTASASYQSLWLKRIELSSLSSFSKYKYLNSQVTFSTFAWSLDIQRGQSDALHPARAFDTLECTPANQSVHLQFVLEGKLAYEEANLTPVSLSSSQLFEESTLEFLGRRTNLPRSQVNALEVDVSAGFNSSFSNTHVLVKAVLVGRPSHLFERTHLGWLRTIKDLPPAAWKKPRGLKRELTRRECSMALATELSGLNKFFMLYCRKSNCGYLDGYDSLAKISYVQKSAQQNSAPSEYQDPCELYLQQDYNVFPFKDLKPRQIQNGLREAEFNLDVADKVTFKGEVRKVSVTGGSNFNSIGSLLRDGSCFTDKTSLSLTDKKFKVNLVELALGQHHSLIYCHKACLFQSGCTTYSYSKSSRVCTLTNVPQKFVLDLETSDNLLGLKKDSACAIYSLNAIHLYRQKPEILMTSMEDLSLMNYYFEPMTVDDCAKLCHSIELTGADKSLRCNGFFRFDTICAIHDTGGSRLFEQRLSELDDQSNALANKTSYFIKLLGESQWQLIQNCYQYERDYQQYYVVEPNVRLELVHDNVPLSQRQQSARFSLVKTSTIYDLDYEACLRECTLIKPDCVIVDYCFQPVHHVATRLCHLYHVQPVEGVETPAEILAADISIRASLNDLEVMRFVEQLDHEQKYLKKVSAGCKHHRLTDDNLMFKRQMARFQTKGDSRGNLSDLAEIALEDARISQSFVDSLQNLFELSKRKVSESQKSSVVAKVIAILLGLTTGALVFLSKPSSFDRNLDQIRGYLDPRHLTYLFRSRSESSSFMEINEMDNIGSPDVR